MDERERRLAQNEALFREVNERVETLTHQLGPKVPYAFLCECSDPGCTKRISLPLPVYEQVRADGRQFVVLPRHYVPDVEDVVIEEKTYWVVRKTGEAGAYAEELEDRS